MVNRTAAALVLRDGDKPRLEQWVRSTAMPAGLVSRARLVLLASEGVANQDIAAGDEPTDGEPVAEPVWGQTESFDPN